MKKLVAYFSATGTTAAKAKELAAKAGADLHEITPKEAYTAADLNWRDPASRCTKEYKDHSIRPALADAKTDLSAYDTIYIGFPIWWGDAPLAVNSFIDANDFTGKKVIVFATSGGSPIAKAEKDLKADYPELNIVKSEMLNGPVTEKDL